MSLKLAMELTEAWKDKALQEGVRNGTVRINFNSSIYDWVADQVFGTAPLVPDQGQ